MAESNGLLDLMKSPAAMGLLAAGFGGLAGANRNTPYNNLGRAGLAGLAGYSAADALQQKQYKIDQEKAVQAAIPTLYGENGTFDYRKAAELGVSPADIKGYAEAANAGRPKVTRTIKVPGINGGMTEVLVDEYGNRAGEMDGYVAPQLVDTGDKKQFVTPQAGQSFTVGWKPSERDASARGWASHAQSAANQPFQVVNGQTVPNANYQQYQIDKAAKGATTINTGDNPQGYSNNPLPVGALKVQDEALTALASADNLDSILAKQEKLITDGKLSFGPVANVINEGKNAAGFSDEQSRNLASFKSDLERMRNESLRLNAGVQTDGDAQRAWNELFQNINDTELVKQRLGEIRKLNSRAAELQRLRVNSVRANYNVSPYDFGQNGGSSGQQAETIISYDANGNVIE